MTGKDILSKEVLEVLNEFKLKISDHESHWIKVRRLVEGDIRIALGRFTGDVYSEAEFLELLRNNRVRNKALYNFIFVEHVEDLI